MVCVHSEMVAIRVTGGALRKYLRKLLAGEGCPPGRSVPGDSSVAVEAEVPFVGHGRNDASKALSAANVHRCLGYHVLGRVVAKEC
jgi:hypothetical protein